ncbi:MAG: pyrimidine dimer DNA glycosylase/endonuclease V [Candidatus Aenigmatarchaeota archaeon]
MRLWSLHPKYLDSKGLVAQWREGLLAKKVLEGKTKGYKNHPQLQRFKLYPEPIKAINSFLTYTLEEAERRGYKFDRSKIQITHLKGVIDVKRGQLKYEFRYLLKKLERRDKKKFKEIMNEEIEPSPLFNVVDGGIEDWEKIKF